MECTSCHQPIPASSKFCPNCGGVVVPAEPQRINTNTPAAIADVRVSLGKEMHAVRGILGGDSGKVARAMTFAVQLVDAAGVTTASPGTVTVKAGLHQEETWDNGIYGPRRKVLLQTSIDERAIDARLADFDRSADGKLWWKYTRPATVTIVRSHVLSGHVEVWFAPGAGGKKLHTRQAYVISGWD